MSTCTVMYCWCFDHKINGTNWGVVVVLIMSHSKFKTMDKLYLTFLSLYSLLNFARRKCAEKLRGLRR